MGLSWLQIIAIEASSHSWPVFVGFSWDFRGPTKNEISGKIGEFSWPFRGHWCPSTLPWRALKRTSFLAEFCSYFCLVCGGWGSLASTLFISATDAPLFLGVDACWDPGEGQF